MDFDREKAQKNIETVLEKIQSSDTEIFLLKEYHKLYRKEISLFKRSMAAAWLFMYYDKREIPQFKKTEIGKTEDRRNESNKTEVTLSEDESKKLFVSIGKNRRLFPKEIITLIMSKSATQREDIGVIKILDNFSFVQVRDSKADEIIEALNGIRFRGRTLTVNYAKTKNPEE